jgi:cyanophycin synthetase
MLHPATVARWLYRFQQLRLWRHRPDPAAAEVERCRAAFYEDLWRQAADAAGAELEYLGYGIFEVRKGDFFTRVSESTCGLDDPVALAVAGNKPLLYRLLARNGLPVPRHCAFRLRTIDRALEFLSSSTGPWVVKPASGTGAGRGVTTGIRRPWQLVRAAAAAAVYDGELLVEEQLEGDNFRLLYLDGELLDAVQRMPPTVTGDGMTTVRGLIDKLNAERLTHGSRRCQVLLTIDLDLRHTLARQGLRMSSIPATGQMVTLKTVINQNFGPDNVTATHRLCPELIAAGAQAARVAGARLAGIDVLTRDPSVPLKESGGVVLEVNTTPGFQHHYHKRDGSFPVAVRVLECLIAQRLASGGCQAAEGASNSGLTAAAARQA